MLGKAVHSLSRIGDELYLEPLKDGVRDWDAGMGADSMVTGEPRLGVHSALQGWWTDISAQFIISWVVQTSAWALSSQAACVYRGHLLFLERLVAGKMGLK